MPIFFCCLILREIWVFVVKYFFLEFFLQTKKSKRGSYILARKTSAIIRLHTYQKSCFNILTLIFFYVICVFFVFFWWMTLIALRRYLTFFLKKLRQRKFNTMSAIHIKGSTWFFVITMAILENKLSLFLFQMMLRDG